MLQSIPQAEAQKRSFLKEMQERYIDRFYDYYISPFLKYNGRLHYSDSEHESDISGNSTSRSRNTYQQENNPGESIPTSSVRNSLERLAQNHYHKNKESTKICRRDFRNALEKRDLVCSFCWRGRHLYLTHIIGHRSKSLIPEDVRNIMEDTGIHSINQVQNGFLMCPNCNACFDSLDTYVDFVDMKFVVKQVNYANNQSEQKHTFWKIELDKLSMVRTISETYLHDDRKVVESNGEMALYFKQDNQALQPSKIALEKHKTACLIWRMAGGLVSYYYDDDDESQEFIPAFNKPEMISKWMESSDTLFGDEI
jgi:protein-arginine kinase activator protein McsA